MNQDSLADRFVNYKDAVAAFSVVNAIAFLIALSELEVRCSLSKATPVLLVVYPIWAAVQSALLLVCDRQERRLRASGSSQAADVTRVLRRLDVARHALVWGITLLSLWVAILAGNDPSCGG